MRSVPGRDGELLHALALTCRPTTGWGRVMTSFSDLLKQLQEQMATAEEMSTILKFFMDHLGENPEFIRRSQKAKHEIVKLILTSLCQDLFGQQSKVTGLMLFNASNTRFFHGACQMEGRLVTVLYFDDIEMGLIAIMSGPAFGQLTYARFSATAVKAGDVANIVAPERKTFQ